MLARIKRISKNCGTIFHWLSLKTQRGTWTSKRLNFLKLKFVLMSRSLLHQFSFTRLPQNCQTFFSFSFPPSFPSSSAPPSILCSSSESSSVSLLQCTTEFLRQREAERSVAETFDGVSVLGPELEAGEGGGREEETEGWERRGET